MSTLTGNKSRIEKIENILNQAIIYLENTKYEHRGLYISPVFKRDFNPEYNYIKDYESDKSEVKRNKLIIKNDKVAIMEIYHFSVPETYGNKIFEDEESIEFSEDTIKTLSKVSAILSNYLNCEILIREDVSIDYRYKLHALIRVELLEDIKETTNIKEETKVVRRRKTITEKKNDALQNVDKYQRELDEFNENLHKRLVNQKSSKKGCGSCGSSIAVSYLHSHKCPVCKTPFYTTTDLKRVNNLNERITKYKKEFKKFVS